MKSWSACAQPPDMQKEPPLTLAGNVLPPPRIHAVEWAPRQLFSVHDDPDRTKYSWGGPSFLHNKDPVAQRVHTTVEELDAKAAGVTGFKQGRSFARIVHNVLTEEECSDLLRDVNEKGFTPALLNVGEGRQMFEPSIRDGLRVILDSEPLARYLLEILRPHLPDAFESGGQVRKLVDLNERCRFLCYKSGQEFQAHMDGMYTRTPPHPNAGDSSRVTVQFYLHDTPPANGGATTFLGRPSRWMGRGRAQHAPSIRVQPRAGSALLFTQDLLHEGSQVRAGFKYTMRTEAMYRDAE